MTAEWISRIVSEIANMDDRDSPEDWPEAMLVTADELTEIISRHATEGPAFGVIDPDYARIYTQARIIAWQYGYSCCAQGSFTRDLDLLLVPWTEGATKEIGGIIVRLADVCGLRIQGAPSEKPHGRQAWTLMLPGFSEVRWVDVSAFQATPSQPPKGRD